jgi:hypothetical protein
MNPYRSNNHSLTHENLAEILQHRYNKKSLNESFKEDY